MTPLENARLLFQPPLPSVMLDMVALSLTEIENSSSPPLLDPRLADLFPHTHGARPLLFEKGKNQKMRPLRVGVVLSGGQAAGGHNVIIGLFDALLDLNENSRLFGFLGGPGGIVDGKSIELEGGHIVNFRNTGGFDMIGSGRTKIETEQQLNKALSVVSELKLDGLVVIGGDDSNTNAAVLAEYFIDHGCATKVIGVPKTIDGDLKSSDIEISFGFDTATKTYSELIGNIARDALSAKKYFHFIKLMGRSASHIALECALSIRPNLTLIGEEVKEKGLTLESITSEIADLVVQRSEAGKDYGIVLIPEGLIEFIPEMELLITELNTLLAKDASSEKLAAAPPEQLSKEAKNAFDFLPEKIQQQLLLDRDPHGNVRVSQISTESLFIETVTAELNKRNFKGKFSPIPHFFGYGGRAGFPSNFDATYCYSLGHVAALLLNARKTGYMACLGNLSAPASEWVPKGIPITSLMHIEMRGGHEKPVIQKTLVDLQGEFFQSFVSQRDDWQLGDLYRFPGPIQFFGPDEIVNSTPITL